MTTLRRRSPPHTLLLQEEREGVGVSGENTTVTHSYEDKWTTQWSSGSLTPLWTSLLY